MVMTNLSSASSNCWGDGGVQIDVGVDDNKNGVLDSSEIDDTTYICNGGDGVDGNDGADGNDGNDGNDGTDGTDGQDGADGADGADGTYGTDGQDGADGSASPNTMLTSISSPAASLGCTAGGRVMMQGLDNGDGGGTAQNGVLESGEVDYTTTYCSKYVIWQVDDINSGTGDSSPGYYGLEILVGDTLYFDATDVSSGHELWAHDTSNSSTCGWLISAAGLATVPPEITWISLSVIRSTSVRMMEVAVLNCGLMIPQTPQLGRWPISTALRQ